MKRRFSDRGIRERVLWLTAAPLLVMTAVLTGYSISSRLGEAVDFFQQRGETLVNAYAASAEFELFAGNIESLAVLAETALKEDAVISVVIEDESNQILIRAGQPLQQSSNEYSPANGQIDVPRTLQQPWLFVREVRSQGLDVSDTPASAVHPGDEAAGLLLGKIILALNPQPIKALQQQMILDSLVIALVGLVIVLLLAYRFVNRIVQPLREVIDVVDRLEQQQLDVRIRGEDAGGDLGRLQAGINAMAARLEHARRELQQKVEDATADLRHALTTLEGQNADLEEARKQADEANHAKDEFLARMSHELRTPLTTVLGYARLLQKSELQGKQKHHLHAVDQASRLLLSIINDLLEFSRLQSGTLRLESVPFKLFDAVNDVCQMLELPAQEKELTLEVEFSAQLPAWVIGDRSKVQQILTNLVNNAIKFTARGGVKILVSGERFADDELKLSIKVIDTGIGISRQDQEKLFKAFSQADNSISRRFGGFGLGLVITQQLAEMMDGEVSLDSVPGQGTTVICKLKLDIASDSSQQDLQGQIEVAEQEPSLHGYTLLLVEDNQLNRDLIAEILAPTGANLVRAGNGETALLRLKEHAVDVVIMDVHLPGLDGVETTRRIRQLSEPNNQVSVIALTANLLSTERQALRALQVEHILLKPIDERQLLNLLQELCGKTLATPAAARTTAVSDETINLVLEDIRTRLARILNEGESMTMQQLRSETHQIRGLAGMFKLMDLQDSVAELDQLAMDGDRDACIRQAILLEGKKQ